MWLPCFLKLILIFKVQELNNERFARAVNITSLPAKRFFPYLCKLLKINNVAKRHLL